MRGKRKKLSKKYYSLVDIKEIPNKCKMEKFCWYNFFSFTPLAS